MEADRRDSVSSPSPMSFDDLYEAYATDVLRIAYYYLGDRQQAEDITQDVFIRFITAHPILESGKEKALLLKVTLNRCRDHWRSAWVRRVVLGHPAFELFPDRDEISALAGSSDLARAVHDLPPDFKEVVLLHYYQGYDIREIAEMTQVAEGTVSSRLSRARARLKKLLGPEDCE